jgi:hypothetical protein
VRVMVDAPELRLGEGISPRALDVGP